MKLIAEGAYDANGRRKYLNRNEGAEFLRRAAPLPKSRAIFCEFLYYTGCRITEGLNLRHADIDVTQNTVLIRSLKKRGKPQVRRIPIPEGLTKRLLGMAPADTGLLWSFSRTTGWRIVKTVMRGTGIIGIHATSKGLRHAFGVRCATANVPLPIIQGWMGHADPATTAIYLAVKDDEERMLIEKTW